MTERLPKILFVGMHSSIHVARWIGMASRTGWLLHLFPVFRARANENLTGVTLHWPCEPDDEAPVEAPQPPAQRRNLARLAPPAAKPRFQTERFHPSLEELGGEETLAAGAAPLGESRNSAPLLFGPGVLASVIRRVRPDLIHSMEFQRAGYLVLKTKEIFGPGFPPWLATNWGSDIFHFRQYADHHAQLKRLLAGIDLYSCECRRDIGLARELGYAGPALPILPNSGGFDIGHVASLRSDVPPSRRRLLMIKGYQHFAGRAMTALAVLERYADRLKDYEIILYSVSEEPFRAAQELVARGILNIRIVGYATHDEMLSYFGQARLYMGISVSDGISTSILEAMAMGAFPIQTDTSCCDEWFRDGEGGFIVPPDDFDLICARFERALDDDELVDRAAVVNWATVQERLDEDVIRERVGEFYDRAFGLLGGGRAGARKAA